MADGEAGPVGELTVRETTEADLDGWTRALAGANYRAVHAGEADWRRRELEPGRWLGAYDADRCVGTLGGAALDLSLPGGAVLPVLGIGNAAVLPTHRRRGLLGRLLRSALRAAAARGEAAAVLHTAAYPLYGRYGFAPATRHGGFTVDTLRAAAGGGLRPGPSGGGAGDGRDGSGGLHTVSMLEVRRLGPALFNAARRRRAGAVSRSHHRWRERTGELVPPWRAATWTDPTAVVYEEPAGDGGAATGDGPGGGRVTGLLLHRTDTRWTAGAPDATLTVDDLVATTPAALRGLWRYLLSLDWVQRIDVPDAPADDPLPHLLADARAVAPLPHTDDCLWLRLLDLPKALAARSYGRAGRLVLEVADPDGHTAGRWRLRVAADGAGFVTRTEDAADLALDAAALAALYLGGESAARLAAAGRLTPLRPDAVAVADGLFRTPLAPWCPDHF